MSEWKKVKIGDICKIVKGTTGIASAEPGQYPLVVTAEERKTCSTYQFDCEAVCIPLVSSSGHGKKSLKNVHYQSGKFALGTILCAVIPNNPHELDARYLHQYLQFYKDIILVPLMKGAANVSLSMKDIATVEFPLPPIERQRELSNLFVSLQEKQKDLSTEYEKQIEYAKLLRQNILQEAIEGKLTADWRKQNPVQKGNPNYDAEALFERIQKNINNEKSGKINIAHNDLDGIPVGWKYVNPEEIGQFTSGKTPPKEELLQEGKPYFRVSDMNSLGNEVYLKYTDNYISKSSSLRCFPKDSIVFPKNGGAIFTNKKRILQTESLVDLNTGVYIPSKLLNQRFSFWLFSTINFTNYWKGTTLPTIDMDAVRRIKWMLPPLKEQEVIVNKVEALLTKVTTLENQIQARKSLSDRLIFGIIKENLEEK